MAASSMGTSRSPTFVVTTGASPPPPRPPRPRPPPPPLPGPAAAVLLLQLELAAAAVHRKIISARLKAIGSTRGYEDCCAAFTENSSFDVSLRKTYRSPPRGLGRDRLDRRRGPRQSRHRSGSGAVSTSAVVRAPASGSGPVHAGDPRQREERQLRSGNRPARRNERERRPCGALARADAAIQRRGGGARQYGAAGLSRDDRARTRELSTRGNRVPRPALAHG